MYTDLETKRSEQHGNSPSDVRCNLHLKPFLNDIVLGEKTGVGLNCELLTILKFIIYLPNEASFLGAKAMCHCIPAQHGSKHRIKYLVPMTFVSSFTLFSSERRTLNCRLTITHPL
jgi:hypothetical protein